jgi:hypothetical protein
MSLDAGTWPASEVTGVVTRVESDRGAEKSDGSEGHTDSEDVATVEESDVDDVDRIIGQDKDVEAIPIGGVGNG